jgi:hypothetical protein
VAPPHTSRRPALLAKKAQEYATERKALQAPPRAKADTAPSVFSE